MSAPDRLYFTGDDEADALLAHEPMALLIGFALDQQVTVPTAFAGPLKLKQRLGTLDPGRIAKTDPAELEAAFREKPAIHRFPGHDGDARPGARGVRRRALRRPGGAALDEAADSDDLRRRIEELPGFGEMKIKALGSVLAKRFGVDGRRRARPAPPHARRRRLGGGARRVPGREARLQGVAEEVRQRVVAYVTRERDGATELLVFERPRPPDRGRPGSGRSRTTRARRSSSRLRRELHEESRTRGCGCRPRARAVRPGPKYENHAFEVRSTGDLPDTWEHEVHGKGDDAGLVFLYRWEPVRPDLDLFDRRDPMLEKLSDGARVKFVAGAIAAALLLGGVGPPPAAGRLRAVPGGQPVEPARRRAAGRGELRRDHRDDRHRHRPPPRLRLGQVGRRPDRDPVQRRHRDARRRSTVTFDYADESDRGPYPIPKKVKHRARQRPPRADRRPSTLHALRAVRAQERERHGRPARARSGA